jgi:hypothetical protein
MRITIVSDACKSFNKNFPESAPRKITMGRSGADLEKDLQSCPLKKHVFADPDGVLLDIGE